MLKLNNSSYQNSFHQYISFGWVLCYVTFIHVRLQKAVSFQVVVLLMIYWSLPNAVAQQSEIDRLLSDPHETSWGYFRDQANRKWYISNSAGITYALGQNNSHHSSWIQLGNGQSVTSVDFNSKIVTIGTLIHYATSTTENKAISLVGGEADQTIYGPTPHQWASYISGYNLYMDWYFFRVASSGIWYIIDIFGSTSRVLRLNLNTDKSDYAWAYPTEINGRQAVTANIFKKEFINANGVWKVRFSLPDFEYDHLAYSSTNNGNNWCYPQCVDFVRENARRPLDLPRGWLYAKYYWTTPHEGYSNYEQGVSTRPPRPGDILVWKGSLNPGCSTCICPTSGCGHVALVQSVNLGTGTLIRVDANWYSTSNPCGISLTEMTISRDAEGQYTIGGSGSSHLYGWQSRDDYFPVE